MLTKIFAENKSPTNVIKRRNSYWTKHFPWHSKTVETCSLVLWTVINSITIILYLETNWNYVKNTRQGIKESDAYSVESVISDWPTLRSLANFNKVAYPYGVSNLFGSITETRKQNTKYSNKHYSSYFRNPWNGRSFLFIL